MVGGPPPKVVLPTRRNAPVNRASVGVAILFFGSDAQGLHLPIEMAALQAQQFGGARDVPSGLFEFLENVVALGRLTHFLQAAEAVHRTVEHGAPGAVD